MTTREDGEPAGWIWTDNLQAFLWSLAGLVGYRFDALDWSAFESGVGGTDSERGKWFTYPLGAGERPTSVAVALESGADEMASVRVMGCPNVEREIRMLIGVCQDFLLTPRQMSGRQEPFQS